MSTYVDTWQSLLLSLSPLSPSLSTLLSVPLPLKGEQVFAGRRRTQHQLIAELYAVQNIALLESASYSISVHKQIYCCKNLKEHHVCG